MTTPGQWEGGWKAALGTQPCVCSSCLHLTCAISRTPHFYNPHGTRKEQRVKSHRTYLMSHSY